MTTCAICGRELPAWTQRRPHPARTCWGDDVFRCQSPPDIDQITIVPFQSLEAELVGLPAVGFGEVESDGEGDPSVDTLVALW